jgi:hypothetical protein
VLLDRPLLGATPSFPFRRDDLESFSDRLLVVAIVTGGKAILA